MSYKYRVYTIDKRVVQGTIDAANESMAEAALYRQGYLSVLSMAEARPGRGLDELIPTFFGVKTQEVIDFSNQLATLIEGGIPLLTALRLLEGLASRAALRKIIAGIAEELQGGNLFSQALGKYPQAFSHTHCQVIKASEQAGTLELGLRQVASYLEKRSAMKQRVTRALMYPIFVLLMAIGVSALLVTVALPPLIQLFTSLGAELPLATRLLIASASFLIDYKLYLLGVIIALIILVAGFLRLPTGKLTWDRFMLSLPVIGSINIQRQMCYFCQTTAMLLRAGLRLPQIMDIVIQTMGNRIVRRALGEVQAKLILGQGLSQPMAVNNLFPKLLVEMVVVGEKTGNLDSALTTLGDFYEKRVDQRISTLITMIEPALTVVVGVVVVFIALSMITPLYSILRSMP